MTPLRRCRDRDVAALPGRELKQVLGSNRERDWGLHGKAPQADVAKGNGYAEWHDAPVDITKEVDSRKLPTLVVWSEGLGHSGCLGGQGAYRTKIRQSGWEGG